MEKDPAKLHNTDHKIQVRREMLAGKRPSECEYCWKIEEVAGAVSDRTFQSQIYPDEEVLGLKELSDQFPVVPRTLEVAFDSVCQFACMYCNQAVSSEWMREIRLNGPFQDLPTDKDQNYTRVPFRGNSDSPYVEAFWRWWPTLSQHLVELRITGGEPLLSPRFWKLMSEIVKDKDQPFNLAVNSNLGVGDKVIARLLGMAENVRHLEVYTSCEAFGEQAEYIRDGLEWGRWHRNLIRLLDSPHVKKVHIMMTVNVMSLFSMQEFLQFIAEIKKVYRYKGPYLSMNILRHPTFFSPLLLPIRMRTEIVEGIRQVRDQLELVDFEQHHLDRLLDYLVTAQTATYDDEPHDLLRIDLVSFLKQYEQRRKNKRFAQVFPPAAVEWWTSLVRNYEATGRSYSLGHQSPDSDRQARECNELAGNPG